MADKEDDLLDPTEIEALINAHKQSKQPAGTPPPPKPASSELLSQDDLEGLLSGGAGGIVNQNDIESLIRQREAASQPATRGNRATETLLNQVEAGIHAAVAPDFGGHRGIPKELGEPTPFQFESFSSLASRHELSGLDRLQEVELDVSIELGRAELLVEEVLKLREGSVVPLDKLAGDPVDILVNGRLVARGEVLVLNDNLCVRVAEILSPALRKEDNP